MKDPTARLNLSRQTLYGWQQGDGPVGKPEDLLRMIGEEIETLNGIADAHAELTESVSFLVERYRALERQIRQRPN